MTTTVRPRPTTAVKLTDHTRSVLASATADGRKVTLTCGQLPPDLFAPVKEVLEAIGGVWSRKLAAYVFPQHIDPAPALADVCDHGRVPMHPRKAEGYVRTPAALAEEIVSWWARDIGSLEDGATVLEPSAGDGSLVLAILEFNSYVHVHAVEPDPQRAHALRMAAEDRPGRVTVHEMTFEEFAAGWTGPGFNAVVMNPPFTVPGNRVLWAEHVLLAHKLTYMGGHVAAIVPNSFPNPPGHKAAAAHREVADLVAACGGFYSNLGRDAFKESGTGVLAGVLSLPKPLPFRPGGRPLWLFDGTGLPQREPVPSPGCWPLTWQVFDAVQSYGDRRNGHHTEVVRLAGQCFGCSRPMWVHDSGREHALNWSLSVISPANYGMTGPEVILCMSCCNHSAVYQRAYDAIRPYWTETTNEPASPAVYALDLDRGLFAEVTGVDSRGGEFTFAGQVMATPEHADDGILVKLRNHLGVDIELTVAADRRVTVLDAPGYDWIPPGPEPGAPVAVVEPVTAEPVAAPVPDPAPDADAVAVQLSLFGDRGWAPLVRATTANGPYSR